MKREITIAGGGLASLSLAVALRKHAVEVCVLEAGFYPRHRVCGEFISGTDGKTFSALGIAEVFADARRHRSLAWYASGRLIHQDRLIDPALGISRYCLDERLWNLAIQRGACVQTRHRVRPDPREGMVWTAGRRPIDGPWIGLKAHVRGLPLTADLEMHQGRNGYVGLAEVEDSWINVCGLFRLDRGLRGSGASLISAYLNAGGNVRLAEALSRCEWRDGSFSAVAGFRLGRQVAVPGLLALGDAESLIPPFTGNGMSMAFQAAELAAEPLAEWAHGSGSWPVVAAFIRRELVRKFRRRLTAARLMHAAFLAPVGCGVMRRLSQVHGLPLQSMLALVR